MLRSMTIVDLHPRTLAEVLPFPTVELDQDRTPGHVSIDELKYSKDPAVERSGPSGTGGNRVWGGASGAPEQEGRAGNL